MLNGSFEGRMNYFVVNFYYINWWNLLYRGESMKKGQPQGLSQVLGTPRAASPTKYHCKVGATLAVAHCKYYIKSGLFKVRLTLCIIFKLLFSLPYIHNSHNKVDTEDERAYTEEYCHTL